MKQLFSTKNALSPKMTNFIAIFENTGVFEMLHYKIFFISFFDKCFIDYFIEMS